YAEGASITDYLTSSRAGKRRSIERNPVDKVEWFIAVLTNTIPSPDTDCKPTPRHTCILLYINTSHSPLHGLQRVAYRLLLYRLVGDPADIPRTFLLLHLPIPGIDNHFTQAGHVLTHGDVDRRSTIDRYLLRGITDEREHQN